MKLNIGKRIVLFLHWLFSLIAALSFVDKLREFALEWLQKTLTASYCKVAFIALAAIYGILSIAVLVIVFKRDGKRSERGFITVDSSDTGKVRMAVSAIEQLVKQAASAVEGIAEMKISIENNDDAISIKVNLSLFSGAHVPTTTLNMQRSIRQFVEMNCGVAVQNVTVNVQSIVAPEESGKKGHRGDVKPMPVYEAPAPVVPEVKPLVEEENVPQEVPTLTFDVPKEETVDAEEPEANAQDE